MQNVPRKNKKPMSADKARVLARRTGEAEKEIASKMPGVSVPAPGVSVPASADEISAALSSAVKAFRLPNAGDLANIAPSIVLRAIAFLHAYSKTGRYRPAMNAANVMPYELQAARRQSEAFARMQDDLREAARAHHAAAIEDTMQQLAEGEYVTDKGEKLNPDTRAATLVLQATDAAYKPGQQAPVSNIQINVQF